jgi:hypothetical protein
MSDTGTLTPAVLTTEGRVLVEQPDGSYRPAKGESDWARVDRVTRQGRGTGARINAILRLHDEHARHRLRP